MKDTVTCLASSLNVQPGKPHYESTNEWYRQQRSRSSVWGGQDGFLEEEELELGLGYWVRFRQVVLE